MKIETIETLANVGSKTTAGGAVVGGIGAFIASNFVGLAGILIALIGVWVNIHYKRKAAKRYAEESAAREARHAARNELQIALGKQAMQLREEARQQKADEWKARMEFMKANGRPPADPPPTDWGSLEELKFTEEADHAQEEREQEEERRNGGG